jgi:anti-sigma B factor antagonist
MVQLVTVAPQFEVFVDGDGVCIVRGELDEFTGSELEAMLRSRPDVATIDLGEVSFVDSAGLRALLVIRQERADVGATIAVRRSSGAVRRVMRLAGVAHLFTHDEGATSDAGPAAAG